MRYEINVLIRLSSIFYILTRLYFFQYTYLTPSQVPQWAVRSISLGIFHGLLLS